MHDCRWGSVAFLIVLAVPAQRVTNYSTAYKEIKF